MTTQIPLLNLTPIYLQNTDNILNTLIFMDLDQGHDFHDGSARTKTSSGLSTWVDLDVKGKGFINQIKKTIFNDKYKDRVEPHVLTSANGEIFGNNDFIKGSLNTTFVGGNGAYGFVVLEDEDLKKYTGSVSIEQLITEKIKEEIKIKILNTPDKVYFVSENDTKGENGKTFEIENGGENINILFLPFYQRVYNGAMHKLWTFNTIKHIYIVKLTQLTFNKSQTSLEITDYNFTCERFTTISQIVPQYVLNFKNFINGKKGNKTTALIERFKQALTPDELEENKSFFAKRKDQLSFINTLPINIKKKIFHLFSISLMTNEVNINGIENIVSQESNNVTYDETTNRFALKIPNLEFLEFISRGTKYYFEDCATTDFKHFLKLLYLYEKPFIHPNYICSKPSIDDARNTIFTKLQGELLETYDNNKNSKTKLPDTDANFISKQYGFITDTNIGSKVTQTTAESLIDSFNNITELSSQSGGAFEKFPPDTERFLKNIISDKNADYNQSIKTNVKKILGLLEDEPNCQELSNELKDFILDKYGKDISKDITCSPSSSPDLTQSAIFMQPRQTSSSSSLGTTTGETISEPIATAKSEVMNVATSEPMILTSKVKSFNNIANVNKVFDLTLPTELTKPFVQINSKSTTKSIDEFVNNYSNNLQLYYDYISQNEDTTANNNNYFNNCWQSTDFYQIGGAEYPFKFTIASGSLDSSSLGGQSIPQYHPPEVDIYMPIFNISGDKSNLKGAIVRMVIVKEILNNPVNSKSKVFVFCHFVYVDFERTGVLPPRTGDDSDTISEYPRAFKELLEFTINNTIYVKDASECVNDNEVNIDTLNNDENIDFKLINLDDGQGNKTRVRNWYKYFTSTQGPTVNESIVIPVNYNSRTEIELGTKFDPVASGIINVAEKIIDNSGKLREIFTDDKTQVQFIKLFLIRNKYTGDKSRSTDTLFLNQIKYLEGVQISNDENTLYNAQMFGLNTVWSTSAKSVFYMAPYFTKQEKIPITTGVYIDELSEGLLQNPNLKTYMGVKGEPVSTFNEDLMLQSEIRDELISKLNPLFIENYLMQHGKNNQLSLGSGFIAKFVECIFDYRVKLNRLNDKFLSVCNSLDEIINKCSGVKIEEDYDCKQVFLNDKNKESFPFQINGIYKELTELIINIKNNDIPNAYGAFMIFNEQINNSETLETGQLNNLTIYLIKSLPYWLGEVLDYKQKQIDYDYCKTYQNILDKINDSIESLENEEDKQYLQKLYSLKQQKKIPMSCDTGNPPVESDNYLKEYISKSPDDEGYDANIEFKNFQDNELKYKILSENVLRNLNVDTRKTKSQLINELPVNVSQEQLDSYSPPSIFAQRRVIPPVQRVTADLAPVTNANMQQLGGMESENTSLQMVLQDNQELEEFYRNSYKCNVGNKLKNFIDIINDIQSKYSDFAEKPFEIDENINTVLIKIFMKNIAFINSSFSPEVNFSNIIESFSKVDNSYTVEQISSLLNLYSEQLEMYSLINNINNGDITPLELIDLLHYSISDLTLNYLKVPYLKYELERKILSEEDKMDEAPVVEMSSDEDKMDEAPVVEMSSEENKSPVAKGLDKEPIIKINSKRKIGISSDERVSKKPVSYYHTSEPWMSSSFNNNSISVYGGISNKNRKMKRFNKTKRQNKKQGKKTTRRKKSVRRRKYTRKN